MKSIQLVDTQLWDLLNPITLTRSCADIRLGIFTIREKWQNLRHGHGKFYYADGGYYEGSWKYGRMDKRIFGWIDGVTNSQQELEVGRKINNRYAILLNKYNPEDLKKLDNDYDVIYQLANYF